MLREDSSTLLKWRNHKSVRVHARNVDEISEDEHHEWVETKLSNKDTSTVINIFTENELLVGMTRLDTKDLDSAEISILIDPELTARGYGHLLLGMTLEKVTIEKLSKKLVAVIHFNNLPSINLFNKFGFKQVAVEGEFISYELII